MKQHGGLTLSEAGSEMATSLIDTVKSLATPDLCSRIASSLGEPVDGVTSGLTGGMSSMLMGVLGKTGDANAMRSIFATVTNSANDGRVLDNPAALVGAPDGALSSLGGQFLSSIFGDRATALNGVLSKASGLGGNSMASVMHLAAPLVLSVLGRRVREGGLNAGSLGRLFESERDGIMRSAPPGVANALGMSEPTSQREREVREELPPREPPLVRQPQEPSRGRRLWPTVLVLAVLALLFSRMGRHRATAPLVVDTTTASAPVSNGEVAPLASATQVRLPNGTVISVPANGAEASLVAFLNDSTRSAHDASWIVLDRVRFASNSAKLDADAQAQAKNIGDILKAYPNAAAKLGGYTDSTEDASPRLSHERAENARSEIEHDGVESARLAAEGYGAKDPVASNATDDGRAQDRRVALLVVKK